MKQVYIREDVDHFISSLGADRLDVLADLLLVAESGPENRPFCRALADGIWEYSMALGAGRFAILLFSFEAKADSFVILHGFRAGAERTRRSDLKIARDRRRGR
jgi:hypothetical protein